MYQMIVLNEEDSDVAGLQMKLNTFNYNAKYHLPKVGNFESIGQECIKLM
jgi:hypothetical protein